MKIEIELDLPSVPNYIMINDNKAYPRTGNERPKVAISDLSDEQLREIGRLWTIALIQRARAK